ncbi:MAG: phosphoribosyl-ATP pyrophosphohydrolase [Rickettsiales bacterium]|jgi:phosphoribosyl-ATP pyrophosphohydrolase
MANTLDLLFSEIKEKIKNDDPKSSYTAFLSNSGSENIAKKGPKHKNGKKQIILETADLLYHSLVLLASKDVDFSDVIAELEKRRQDKNLSEKAILKNKEKLHEK